MSALSGRNILEGLPTVEDIKLWEALAAKPGTELERALATQNLIVALYKSRRRLEAIAMGRDVEATVFDNGGGA